ncbi:MAG: hypothetical protein WCC65_06485, partial [Pseudonocardiaceae bacterium]
MSPVKRSIVAYLGFDQLARTVNVGDRELPVVADEEDVFPDRDDMSPVKRSIVAYLGFDQLARTVNVGDRELPVVADEQDVCHVIST